MKGRPPKPVEVHRAEGTTPESGRRRRGMGGVLPTVVGGRTELVAPAHLEAEVASAFAELAGAIAAISDAADAALVEAAAVQLTRARQAGRDIAERGRLVEVRRVGRDGSELIRMEANPSIRMELDAQKELRLLADRLGIGPAARARLSGLGAEAKSPGDDYDELREMRERRAAGRRRAGG